MKRIENKGITLIALVITIVIMLILAGITLGSALGENGLFTRAKEVVEKYKIAQEKEQEDLEQLEKYLGGAVGKDNPYIEISHEPKEWTNKSVKVKIKNKKEELKLQYSENDGRDWKDYIDEIEITENKKIYARLIDGEKVKEEEVYAINNIDKILPTVGKLIMRIGKADGIECKNNDTVGNSIYIELEDGEDEQSGHKETTYEIKELNETSLKGERILNQEGNYTITVKTLDVAENISTYTYNIKIEKPKIGDAINYIYDDAKDYNLSGEFSGHGTYDNNSIPWSLSTTPQIIKQTKNLKWVIFNIDSDNNIELISETPTENRIYFGGSIGYNNGVYYMNEICRKQYSNNSLGIIARSINLNDIEKGLSDIGKKNIEDNLKTRDKYINTEDGRVQYTQNKYYPNILEYEKNIQIDNNPINTNGIGESDEGLNSGIPVQYGDEESGFKLAKEKIIIKGSGLIGFSTEAKSEYFANDDFFKLLFGADKQYWYASRSIYFHPTANCIGFCLGRIDGNNDGWYGISYSNGTFHTKDFPLRPIVTINNDIALVKNDKGEWNLSKNHN